MSTIVYRDYLYLVRRLAYELRQDMINEHAYRMLHMVMRQMWPAEYHAAMQAWIK